MSEFEFETDERSREFCELIIAEMMQLFGISREEALGRINRQWKGKPFVGDDVIYHEDETFWAKTIYYENMWWLDPPDLTPRPYP